MGNGGQTRYGILLLLLLYAQRRHTTVAPSPGVIYIAGVRHTGPELKIELLFGKQPLFFFPRVAASLLLVSSCLSKPEMAGRHAQSSGALAVPESRWHPCHRCPNGVSNTDWPSLTP